MISEERKKLGEALTSMPENTEEEEYLSYLPYVGPLLDELQRLSAEIERLTKLEINVDVQTSLIREQNVVIDHQAASIDNLLDRVSALEAGTATAAKNVDTLLTIEEFQKLKGIMT